MKNIIFLPDSTYTDKIVRNSEAAYPSNNLFVFLQVLPGRPLRYIKDQRVKVIPCSPSKVLEAMGDITEYKSIHIHYLTQFNAFIVEKLLSIKQFTVIWYMWGGDFYTLPYFRDKIYDSDSSKFATVEDYGLRSRLKHRLKDLSGRPSRYALFRTLRRIDYCISSIPHDIELAREVLGRNLKTSDFSFLSLNDLVDPKLHTKAVKERKDNLILVGNSGDPSNNHLAVFHALSKLRLDHQIVAALGYGNKAYIKEVVKWGSSFFKERFTPITEFLEYEDYLKILGDTEIAIFNHYRQQAVGNILTLVWLGKKVFINRNTTVYKSMLSWGVKVFATEDIAGMAEDEFFKPLSEIEIQHNRSSLDDRFSTDKVILYYKKLLEV